MFQPARVADFAPFVRPGLASRSRSSSAFATCSCRSSDKVSNRRIIRIVADDVDWRGGAGGMEPKNSGSVT